MFLGILIGISLFIFVKCQSEIPEQTSDIPDSFTLIKDLQTDYGGKVYKLTVDNIQYIVVEGTREGGIAIIKHK